MTNKIGKEHFLYINNLNDNSLRSTIKEMLEVSFQDNDKDLLEDSIYLLCKYEDIINIQDYVPLLNSIICCGWHTVHEDIALLLEDAKSPSSIEALYQNATSHYDYLAWDSNYALAVKCIYALGRIASPEALEKLKILAENNNIIIKENALNQLKKLNVV